MAAPWLTQGFGRGAAAHPDVQKKTVLVMKIVAVGAFGVFPLRIAVIFQADADFEVKSAVASYFWAVFKYFLGQHFGQTFVFFSS